MTNENRPIATLKELRLHVPEELITFRVSALSQLLSRLVEVSVGEELGLSSRQWRLLVMLNRLGPSTSGQVAAAARFDQSQVSRASFELVEKGLIEQRTDRKDRRRQLLELTPSGVQTLRRGIVGSRARQDRLRACLSNEQYQCLGTALDALSEEAQAMVEGIRSRERPGS